MTNLGRRLLDETAEIRPPFRLRIIKRAVVSQQNKRGCDTLRTRTVDGDRLSGRGTSSSTRHGARFPPSLIDYSVRDTLDVDAILKGRL